MKILLSVIYCSFLIQAIIAQTPNYSWAKSWGGLEADKVADIVADEFGSVYVTGSFEGTIDFDPSEGLSVLTSVPNGFDSYISKFDSSGQFLWVKQLTASNLFLSNDILFDPAGYVYISGSFSGTADLDPGFQVYNLTAKEDDPFILKIDLDGNFIWALSAQGDDQSETSAQSISLDHVGNVIMVGYFKGLTDFDPGPEETFFDVIGISDGFVAKYSSDGNFIWAKQFAGVDWGEARGVDVDPLGNIYVVGPFNDKRDFDPGADTAFLQATLTFLFNTYVVKLDSAGNYKWARYLDSQTYNWGNSISVDDFGNPHITGYFSGLLDFDPGADSLVLNDSYSSDVFTWKLDTNGELLWASQFKGTNTDEGRSVCLDSYGGVYTTGWFRDTCDFDPGPGIFNLVPIGGSGLRDIFLSKLNANGEFVWAYSIGGLNNDSGSEVILDDFGNLLFTGTFQGVAQFSPVAGEGDSLVSNGSTDVYLARWKICFNSYAEIFPDICGPYTSPSGNYTWYESGVYLDTIPNSEGCDSILIIHFFFMGPQMSIVQQGDVLLAQGNPELAYWLDCDNNFNVVGIGYVLLPPANGNYAVVGESFQCIDTSDCFAFVMTGIENTSDEDDFILYPNPVDHTFHIALPQLHKKVSVEVCDQWGRPHFSEVFFETHDLSVYLDLPAGVYFTIINTGHTTRIIKLILK